MEKIKLSVFEKALEEICSKDIPNTMEYVGNGVYKLTDGKGNWLGYCNQAMYESIIKGINESLF